MNKRIQLLAEQAGLKYHNWITCESNINDGDFKYPRLEDYKKFAELIVQECAGRVDWILAEGGKTQGDLIREHFGVEE